MPVNNFTTFFVIYISYQVKTDLKQRFLNMPVIVGMKCSMAVNEKGSVHVEQSMNNIVY